MNSIYNGLKRSIAGAVCAFVVMTSIIGCGTKTEEITSASTQSTAAGTTQPTKETPKEVTIKVAGYPAETDAAGRAIFDDWAKKTKEKYPYITVVNDAYSYDVNTFFPKAASGQLTNFYQSWFTEVNKIATAGYAADLTETMAKYGYDKALNPDLLKIVQKDGKYYALPDSGYAMSMWYNVNLYKQAGLVDEKGVPKFPKTYDELAEDAKIIKEKTGKPGFFFPAKNNQGGWQFMNIAWAFGAEFEKQVDGKWTAVFNSPEAVAALQYLKDLKFKYDVLQPNVLADIDEMFKLLGTDQVGTAFGSADWKDNPINNFKMSKDNQAMSAVPAGPKGAVALIGGTANFVSADSTPEQIDAVFKYLEIRGYSPNLSDEAKQGFETIQKERNEKNNIAGIYGLRVWTEPNRVAFEDSIYDKYRNVNLDLWKDYMENGTKSVKPEEPINCQELYKLLDGVIQETLTKKDSDPKALLDKAVATFQKDYLDKVK